MRKFTRQDKKNITQDWLKQYPYMGIYKPMWLMNRVGPLVMGILLHVKSGNDNYIPTFHVHCLLRQSSFISLGLHNAILGYVTLPRHEMYFLKVVDEFNERVLIPYEGNITIHQIFNGYREFKKVFPIFSPDILLEEMIKLASWCNEEAMRLELLEEAECLISSSCNKEYLDRIGGLDNWKKKMEMESANQEELQRTFEQELIKHKLEKIPVRNIIK